MLSRIFIFLVFELVLSASLLAQKNYPVQFSWGVEVFPQNIQQGREVPKSTEEQSFQGKLLRYVHFDHTLSTEEKNIAAEKGLEFLCAASPDVPSYLRGDPGRLRQILTNLTGNALKFTTQGEVAVRVSVESREEAETVLRFSIQDTGIGIEEEEISLIFEKFYEVGDALQHSSGEHEVKSGGLGLGLATVKAILQAHGSAVEVESTKGKGSCFSFRLRLSEG
jgi:signal transduction histidine kinase